MVHFNAPYRISSDLACITARLRTPVAPAIGFSLLPLFAVARRGSRRSLPPVLHFARRAEVRCSVARIALRALVPATVLEIGVCRDAARPVCRATTAHISVFPKQPIKTRKYPGINRRIGHLQCNFRSAPDAGPRLVPHHGPPMAARNGKSIRKARLRATLQSGGSQRASRAALTLGARSVATIEDQA